jgi:DNA processing protein
VFASRNRLVVGLADAVLVVAAARRSGSARTGRLALRAGVRVGACIPGPGAEMLVGEGAEALDFGTEGFERWLRGEAPATVRWPSSARWLEPWFARCGAKGLALDSVDDPLRAAVDVLELLDLRLVVERTPGRYVRLDRDES